MKKHFTSLFPTHAVAALRTRFLLLGCLLGFSLVVSAQTTRFVSTTGTNGNPATATSWATATADLQGAINSLSAGGEVRVTGGTYKPTTSTTLSGDIGTGDPGNNSYHVISNSDISSTAILDGFVITGGHANYDDTIDFRNNGAGMLNTSSNPILTNCSFTSNSADSGGGVYNTIRSSPSLTHCLFSFPAKLSTLV
ncbi:hypothetical protein ACS5NO_08210 [Larkinella sp. GY13]|uniref:hypothetical protein n=1 Tax=Larkinella sp. GY13 TaxID=3453720 RepID=UPI003EED11C2